MLLAALSHPIKELRHTAGTCISAVVAVCGLTAWPQLSDALRHILDTGSGHVLDGGLYVLCKVRSFCSDVAPAVRQQETLTSLLPSCATVKLHQPTHPFGSVICSATFMDCYFMDLLIMSHGNKTRVNLS